MRAREELGIPLIVGSCGTSGTDGGVDWIAGICREVARKAGQNLRIALIKSEQDKARFDGSPVEQSRRDTEISEPDERPDRSSKPIGD